MGLIGLVKGGRSSNYPSTDHSRNRATMAIQAEEWRPVQGCEGRYEVSSAGKVKSLGRRVRCGTLKNSDKTRLVPEKILKESFDTDGYAMVLLSYNDSIGRPRCKKVHQLVAHAFLGPQPKGTWVLHGPAGRTDNSVTNLYYGTPKQNVLDKWRDDTIVIGSKHHKAKLNEKDVCEIKTELSRGVTARVLAARYGVHQSAICKIKSGQNWKWLQG